MNNFIITTDTTSDLPAAYVEQHQIGMLSLTYTINDTTYSWEHPLPVKEFYDCMRQGSLPTTSQANPEEAAAVFEKIIKEQNADILHIAFSSGLSGSYNSARLAAGELSEKYPDRKIIVIDSLCASLGEGLLVHKAVTLKEQGHTLEETADWLESNKLHLVHNFTVNDLFDTVSFFIHRDMNGIRITKQIMHISQNLLISTHQEYSHIIRFCFLQCMYRQIMSHVTGRDKVGNFAVRVAGYILQGSRTLRFFIQSLNRHDREYLVNCPRVRK
mgnify:CR=1 FL=1